jgi:hypothetical protein
MEVVRSVEMKLKLNSGLFSVFSPCGYWTFDGLAESNEDYYDSCHEEQMRIADCSPSLFPDMEGTLTMPNPDWRPGHYETDGHKFLDIISKCWVEKFNERLHEAGIEAEVEYTGHWSPKEYNFAHDEADFTLAISETEVQRLVALCIADNQFEQHLTNLYSSGDGFWSFVTNNVDVFAENAGGKNGQGEYEDAVWQAVNFVMFPDAETSSEWNQDFMESVYEKDFSDTLYFVEDEEELAV